MSTSLTYILPDVNTDFYKGGISYTTLFDTIDIFLVILNNSYLRVPNEYITIKSIVIQNLSPSPLSVTIGTNLTAIIVPSSYGVEINYSGLKGFVPNTFFYRL